MKIFALDIDGCIADHQGAVEAAVKKEFCTDIIYDDKTTNPMIKYGIDADYYRKFLKTLRESAIFWDTIAPFRDAIDEMQDWTMHGMVPSIISSRPRETRLVSEHWMARNHVPYSNFLIGVEAGSYKTAVQWIDADFTITDNVEIAKRQDMTWRAKVYFLRRDYSAWADQDHFNGGNVVVVDSFKDIREIEEIG